MRLEQISRRLAIEEVGDQYTRVVPFVATRMIGIGSCNMCCNLLRHILKACLPAILASRVKALDSTLHW